MGKTAGHSSATDAARLMAQVDAKVAELKTVIHEGNAALKDLRAERKELRAQLTWALEEHQKLLPLMVQKSSEEVLRATSAVMESVARQLAEVVQRSQSVQTLSRVDRLLQFVATQLTDDPGDAP